MRQRSSIFFVILVLFLVSCSAEPTVTPTPTPDSTTLAESAGAAMESVDSLHFVFQRDGAPAFVDQERSLAFLSAEGDYLAPDRMQAAVKIAAGGFVAEVQVISVAGEQWMTNLLTGKWEKVPSGWGLDPSVFFDPAIGVPHVIAYGLETMQLDGPAEWEAMEGIYWRLVGETTGEQVSTMSGGLIPPGRVEVEAWIDPSTYLIHRLDLVLPESDPKKPTEWLIRFSDFGKAVDIQLP